MKDIAGVCGLPVHRLGHLQQGLGGASKGQLMDAIDQLFAELDQASQDRVVISAVSEILRRVPESRQRVEEVLARIGWGISGLDIHPLTLQIDLETSQLPEAAQEAVRNCLKRYRDGDISGAMTAVCGLVDGITEQLYREHNLGNHRDASYQERISRAVTVHEGAFKDPLRGTSLAAEEIDRLWKNFRQACNQAGYVLGSFRREFSDAHGPAPAPPSLIQRAIDCAVFIVRVLIGFRQQPRRRPLDEPRA
jgi:hypothetical protein